MRPPLMPELVGGHKIGEIDVGGLLHALDKADALGKRNSVGKGLREGAVAGEFENAVLPELEGTESFLVKRETRLRGGDHVRHIVVVLG